MKNKMIGLLPHFRKQHIAVIGDLMLDRYMYGQRDTVSPEATVPIVKVLREVFSPGGAGNVAINIAALGAEVSLIGLTGKDKIGIDLRDTLRRNSVDIAGIVVDRKRITTLKTRIVAHGQHMLRFDSEQNNDLSPQYERQILAHVRKHIRRWTCIVLSDYAKGCLTRSLCQSVIQLADSHRVKVIADPKPQHADFFRGVYLITPNAKEALRMSQAASIETAGEILCKYYQANVLITQGANGMTLFSKKHHKHYPTVQKEVFDVTGAGDTVIATLALVLSSGSTIEEAIILANCTAGVVVGKVGTATVSLRELQHELMTYE